MVNLNERNRNLLSNLGLDQLFTIQELIAVPVCSPGSLGSEAPGKDDPGADDAGGPRELRGGQPENAAKFKDVLEYLKQDLHLAR